MKILLTTTSLGLARLFRKMQAKFHPEGLKIMRHTSTFCVPGRGVTTKVEYTVEVKS